jgi:hypothetical protein
VRELSLVELVKPDKTKPARLLRDPETKQVYLEYTGVDGNVYRVPIALVFLPQEFGDLATQLTLADLLEMIRTRIADSAIIVPVEEQSVYKSPGTTLYSGTVTSSGSSADIDVSSLRSIRVMVKVTAVSGTSPTLDIYIEGKYEATGDYVPLLSRTGITSTGVYELGQLDNLCFRYIRVRWVVGGTSPSFAITVAAQALA